MAFDLYPDQANAAISAAARNPAVGKPLTFGESLDNAFSAQRAYQQSFSEKNARWDAMSEVLDGFATKTGERLGNPLIYPETTDTAAMGRVQATKRTRDRYEQVRKERPDLGLAEFPDDKKLADMALARMLKARQTYDANEARDEHGVANFIGSAAASLTDPVNAATLAFGAPAAQGVVRTMLIEGALGATGQALITANTFKTRQAVDPNYTAGDALEEISAAAIGGAALGGLLKGLSKVFDRADRSVLTRSQNDAINVVHAEAKTAEVNPLGDTPAATATHREVLDSTVEALKKDDAPVKMPEAVRQTTPDDVFPYDRLPPGERVMPVAPEVSSGNRRTIAPAPNSSAEKAVPLIDWIARNGGIRRDADSMSLGLDDIKVPGRGGILRRNGGIPIDKMREMAAEAGYPIGNFGSAQDNIDKSMLDDLLQAVHRDWNAREGKTDRVLTARDTPVLEARKAETTAEHSDAAVEDFVQRAAAEGLDTSDRTLMEFASKHYHTDGLAPADAVERAARELDDLETSPNITPMDDAYFDRIRRIAGGEDPGAVIAEAWALRGDIGGLAEREMTEDEIWGQVDHPDWNKALFHAAEHVAEGAEADGRKVAVAIDDGGVEKDVRDWMEEADRELDFANEIGQCVIGVAAE